ncbi:MAG: DUF4038 domain-containing protein, partial [Deltaproteobacteria bacterium]|nr:DUF4038 domain-containing protein [Deltaproteobacteria bacterium]
MSFHKRIIVILILSILVFSTPVIRGNSEAAVGKWEVFELTLTTTNSYSNEYTDVMLTATFTSPTNNTIVLPGFWDGGDTWKVRMAPNEIGMWTYVTSSNDGQLDNNSGQFECVASGKKGFIQVNPSDPYKFQYTDGTPFFWMGETSWHLYSDNVDYATEFKDYIDRMSSQHFNNIHAALDVRALNYGHEVGEPFVGDNLDRINPAYFQNVDMKVEYIVSKDMVAGLFLSWAQRFIQFSRPQFERYETYAIARYAAYNVYWVIAGEFEEESTSSEYAYHGNIIDQTDPYDHPISIHTLNTNAPEFGNDSWLTYVMHQNGEQDSTISLQNLLNQLGRSDIDPINPDVLVNVADGNSLYTDVQADRTYDKPVVNAEFGYEAYDGWNNRTGRTTPDTVRKLAWNLVMAGGFFTYGMDKTYKVFDKNDMTNDWDLPAQELGGSDSMKLLYEFMTGTKWWEMSPDNSVIDSGDAVALVNPGIEYVVYLRSGSSVSVDLSAVSGNLKVKWFDTKDGDTFS